MGIFLVRAGKRRMKDNDSQITRNHLSHCFTVNPLKCSERNAGLMYAVCTLACESALPSGLSKFTTLGRTGDGGGFDAGAGGAEGDAKFVFAQALDPHLVEFCWAEESPCFAAFRYQSIATIISRGLPRPCSYSAPRLF